MRKENYLFYYMHRSYDLKGGRIATKYIKAEDF